MNDIAKLIVRTNWLFEANLAQFRQINNDIKRISPRFLSIASISNAIKKISLSQTLLKQGTKEFNALLRNNNLQKNSYTRIYNLYIKRSVIILHESFVYIEQLQNSNMVSSEFINKMLFLKKLMKELENVFILMLSS